MFCKNCGSHIPDGSKFCLACGNSVEAEVVAPVETPDAEPNVNPEAVAFEMPVSEAPVSEEQPEFAQPWQSEVAEVLPKKKSGKLLAWLIPSVSVVVLAALALVFWNPIKGFFLKNFGSASDYRDYVTEKNVTNSVSDSVSGAYGAVVNTVFGGNKKEAPGAMDMSMKLNVGDQVLKELEKQYKDNVGEEIDLAWLNEIELKVSTNIKDNLYQAGAALNIGGEEIAELDGILDLSQGKLLFGLVNLTDEYLAVDILDGMGDIEAMTEAFEDMDKMAAALPTEKEVNELLNKYIGIALDSFEDVEKSTENVKVDNVKQKLTVLETEIDGDDLIAAAEAVLEELSEDKQAKKILERFADYAEDEFDLEMDVDDFFDGIDDVLDALEDADGDDMDVELVLTQYVNSAHEMVGYALEVNEEQILRCVEVKDGNKLAYELIFTQAYGRYAKSLEIRGKGTEKKGTVNAEYTVSSYTSYEQDEDGERLWEGTEIFTFSLVDFEAKDDTVKGKIRIAPSDDLMEQMELPDAASAVISLAQIQLELGLDVTEKSSALDVNVLVGEELLVGVTFTATEKKATSIDLPDEAYDIDDADAWAETIDLEKLQDSLKEAGVPVDAFLAIFTAQKVGPEDAYNDYYPYY